MWHKTNKKNVTKYIVVSVTMSDSDKVLWKAPHVGLIWKQFGASGSGNVMTSPDKGVYGERSYSTGKWLHGYCINLIDAGVDILFAILSWENLIFSVINLLSG